MLCYQGLGDAELAARERSALPALQGRRVVAGDHRPVPAAASRRQQRAAADPRAPARAARGVRSAGCAASGGAAPRRTGSRRWLRQCDRSCRGRRSPAPALAGTRRRPRRPDVHRRHRRPPASASATTAARSARSTCRRRWASGGAFLDADGDGWQDILLVNSTTLAGPAGDARRCRRSTATTATARSPTSPRASGLGVELYGLGVAAADYDNDGGPTSTSPRSAANRLFRNLGGGTFADVTDTRRRRRRRASRRAPRGSTTTATAGSICSSPTTSSGRSRRTCSARSTARRKSYCTPESYKGQSPTLYRNRGDGTFEDVDARRPASTIRRRRRSASRCSTTTATAGSDLFVANDTQPNRLYRNKRQRHVHRRRRDGGRGVQRGGRGARRHGRRRRRLRRLRPARASSSATSRTR